MSKKAVYDRYKGLRKCENAARALSDLLAQCDTFPVTIYASADVCPRCGECVYELRQEPKFRRLMVFCKECHFFLLWDRLGRIKSFASETAQQTPLKLPPVPSPRKPLERQIFNHMQRIKREV